MGERVISAEAYGAEPAELRAEVEEFDRSARLGRAFKIAGPLLLGAIVSLFIPVWHLFGVPGFLVASAVLGTRKYRQTRAIELVAGPCPACKSDQPYPVAEDTGFPLSIPCPACGEFLKLDESQSSEKA